MTDIIVKYNEGDTLRRIESKRWNHESFFNIFYRNSAGYPLYILGQQNRVYHCEPVTGEGGRVQDCIIGFSVLLGRGMATGVSMKLERPTASFKWIKPIPCDQNIKLHSGWAEAGFKKSSVVFITQGVTP